MSNAIYSRPFNLEHAKAGAPVQLRSGEPVRILCFDGRSEVSCPIVGLAEIPANGLERVITASKAGLFHHAITRELPDDLVMAPLAMVEGKPVFVGDVLEYKTIHMPQWERMLTPVTAHFAFAPNSEYRWPKKKVTKEAWRTVHTPNRSAYPVLGVVTFESEAAALSLMSVDKSVTHAVMIGTYVVEE